VVSTGGGGEMGLLHVGGGCSFYSCRRRLANGGVSCGQGWQSGDETRGGRAVVPTVRTRSAWAAPLFGQGG
jgi:hypothetical protein